MNGSLRYKMSTISCYTAIGLIYKDFINSKIKGNVSTKILEQNRKKSVRLSITKEAISFQMENVDITLRDESNESVYLVLPF